MVRDLGRVFWLGTMAVAAPAIAFGWGPNAHREVHERAIGTLEGDLEDFYKDHRAEMATLAFDDPELVAEVDESGNRFAVDALEPFPFLDLPHREDALAEKFGPAAAEAGRLPWLIQESFARLVEAFRLRDKAQILEESDRLAILVTDLHNPLALTRNSDGQDTGQHGLWERFSVKLPEAMGGHLKARPDAAHYLDDPQEFVFSMINANYVWADNIMYVDELAARGKSDYTQIYYESLALRARDIINGRLSEAAEHVGSYWYTAWTDAGRPALK
jgi:hypothetical protein